MTRQSNKSKIDLKKLEKTLKNWESFEKPSRGGTHINNRILWTFIEGARAYLAQQKLVVEALAIIEKAELKRRPDRIFYEISFDDFETIRAAIQQKPLNVVPENLARKFHEAYERLAPAFNYETRKESTVAWADVPENNKRLMIAVCHEILAPQPPCSDKGADNAE